MSIPKVSVIVGAYRPNLHKLLLTLRSILLQKECSYEIILTDDGSKENYFAEVKDFFARASFCDYKLLPSEKNQGTVLNVWKALQVAQGEYIRLISPGDFLHGFFALRGWVQFMDKRPEVAMSFCDAIYYHFEGGEIVPTSEFAHPQHTCAFAGGGSLKPYLLCNDICLGAATMSRTKSLKKYFPSMLHKVLFAEDNVYRIMAYAGEVFTFYPTSAVLYEYGTGISTSRNSFWAEKIHQDWSAANSIMLSIPMSPEAQKCHIDTVLLHDGPNTWKMKLKKWRTYPCSFLFSIKRKLLPRHTPCTLDSSFVHQLLAD